MVVQDRIRAGLPATAQQLIIDYLELVDKSRPLWGFYWPLLRVHDATLASSCVVTIPWWKKLLDWPHRNFIMSLLWIVSYIIWLYLWNPAVLQTKVGRKECKSIIRPMGALCNSCLSHGTDSTILTKRSNCWPLCVKTEFKMLYRIFSCSNPYFNVGIL